MTVCSYGNYASNNSKANSMTMKDEYGNQFWFSYETLVAFQIRGEFHIVQNYWGNTTGKHLNWIDDRKYIRETREEFEDNYDRLMNYDNYMN